MRGSCPAFSRRSSCVRITSGPPMARLRACSSMANQVRGGVCRSKTVCRVMRAATSSSRLGEVPCPDVGLRHAGQRLEHYAAKASDLDYFAGDALLHTDLNNANVLVDETARLVDWAWATRGAPWLDAGYWIVWLMAAGDHAPESAEQWARRIP